MVLNNLKLKNFIIPIILFFTIILGFIFNEDSLGGAKNDFYSHLERTLLFKQDFFYYFINYDTLEHRHSPIFFIFSSKILNFSKSVEIFRFLHLLIPLLIYFFFYLCLKIRFNKIDDKKLALISSLIFISPTIRSYSIWPDSYLYGILFFTISIFYFLIYKYQTYSFSKIFLNIFFLSLSSYFMPIFSIFSVYFFFDFLIFFLKRKLFKEIFLVIFFNLVLALPAFYYIFFLDINFLRSSGEWGLTEKTFSFLNFSNKFFYSSSIIFFHLIPFFFIFLNRIKSNFSLFKDKKFILISLFLLLTFFFSDYDNIYNNLGGGGIFYIILSQIINSPNLQLLLIIPISYIFVFLFQKSSFNYLILFILLFSNFQLTIYHNYFEPIIYLVLFTLILNSNFGKELFSYKNLNILIIFNCCFLFISFIK